MANTAKTLAMEYTKSESITFDSNQLKLIAIAAMVFDHCMVVFVPHDLATYELLRMPGRLTLPIMCFLIAQGYRHTSNLRRYMGRLFAMAIVSHLPFTLCFGYNPLAFWQATDVLWSLLLGLIALSIYLHQGWGFIRKLFCIGLCCLLAYPADWNYIAVLLVLLFGAFEGEKNQQTASHIAVWSLYEMQAIAYGTSMLSKIGFLFSIPLLRRYNGQRGPKSKLIQWGFYWFYPTHLLLLFAVKELLGQ